MALVLLIALIMNTGYQTQNKIRMQNTVDASLISGTKWIARGMNIVSMDNVGMTQVLGIIITLRAMDQTMRNLHKYKVPYIAHEATLYIPFVGPAIYAALIPFRWGGYAIATALESSQVVEKMTKPPSGNDKGGWLWLLMRLFGYLSDFTVKVTPVMAAITPIEVARGNGAELALAFQVAEGGGVLGSGVNVIPVLPVHLGKFNPDLCDPTKNGSPANTVQMRGYRPLLGYDLHEGTIEHYRTFPMLVTAIWFYVAAPAVYLAFEEYNYLMLCSGGYSPPTKYTHSVPVSPYCAASGDPLVTSIKWARERWEITEILDYEDEYQPLNTKRNGLYCQPVKAPAGMTGPSEGQISGQTDLDSFKDQYAGQDQPIDEQNRFNNAYEHEYSAGEYTTGAGSTPGGARVENASSCCGGGIPEPDLTPEQVKNGLLPDTKPCQGCDLWRSSVITWKELDGTQCEEIGTGSGIAKNNNFLHVDQDGLTASCGVKKDDWLVAQGIGLYRITSVQTDVLFVSPSFPDAYVESPENPYPPTIQFSLRKRQKRWEETVVETRFENGMKEVKLDVDQTLKSADQDKMPKPYMLGTEEMAKKSTEEMIRQTADALNFLGVARSIGGLTKARVLGTSITPTGGKYEFFGFPASRLAINDRFHTYAQAQVFNSTSWDMFTQDWHTKLVRTTALSRILNKWSFGVGGEVLDAFNKH